MRILLTGGAASGKSTYAKQLAAGLTAPHYFVDTMEPYWEENSLEAKRQKEQRNPVGFHVLSCPSDLTSLTLSGTGTILVECLCNLTANEMFDQAGNVLDVMDKLICDLRWLENHCEHLIVVTNEIGSEPQSFLDSTPAYVRMLGKLNQVLADRFDCVCEFISGIPLVHKGKLPHVDPSSPGLQPLAGSAFPILILGGARSGKRAYAQSLGYTPEDMSDDPYDPKPVLYDLSKIIARDPEHSMELFEPLAMKQVIICNEVGCGVIPLNTKDRDARLQTGRLCVLLAQRSQIVVRMICGIPTILKHPLG